MTKIFNLSEKQHYNYDSLIWGEYKDVIEGADLKNNTSLFRGNDKRWALIDNKIIEQFGKDLAPLYYNILRSEAYYGGVVSVIYLSRGIYNKIISKITTSEVLDKFIGIKICVLDKHPFTDKRDVDFILNNLTKWQ